MVIINAFDKDNKAVTLFMDLFKASDTLIHYLLLILNLLLAKLNAVFLSMR